ncbi:AAA family ATPase [Candidatus Woesearchaeota archaeon]|nr:AAA family ATPase [Candidatus Woesearchaeota archaeon]
MTTREEFDKIVYSYAANINGLEEENKYLKETVDNLKQEIERYRKKPLLVCKVKELHGESALVKLPNGNEFLVGLAAEALGVTAGDTVLAEQKNLTILQKISTPKRFEVEKFVIMEKPDVTWQNIGGLKDQERELREVIELPLLKPDLFRKVGIHPPKGVLLYGPPGTGKTLLAKAVAASTHSTFIEIVGSELVQKFIGEGAKMVKEVFDLAREKAPSVIFIDEIDSLAATRLEVGTSGEREVQRTFMQLLAEIDGFKALGNVKIIGCTNRRDILDPAITRPGRLDRLIYVPHPDASGRLEIISIHTANMNLDKEVDLKSLVALLDHFSGAEIKAVCTEAGYFAIRRNKTKVTMDDFEESVTKVKAEKRMESDEYKEMFG